MGHCPPEEATILGGEGFGAAGGAADVDALLPPACMGHPGGGDVEDEEAAEEGPALMERRISSRCWESL